jgi:hypothetical protein
LEIQRYNEGAAHPIDDRAFTGLALSDLGDRLC